MSSHTTQGEYQDGVAQGSEEDPKLKYPSLLCSSSPNLGDEIHLKGGRIVTPQNLPLLKIELK